MVEKAISLAIERMVRQAPEHEPLPLDPADADYILHCLAAISAHFDVDALPTRPLDQVPGRELMRTLVDLRANLRPKTDEQHEAWALLASAILRVDVAAAFAVEWSHRKR